MDSILKKHEGSIYLNGKRYWWKVRLPGDSKDRQIPLKFPNQRFATTNKQEAEYIADKLWTDATMETPDSYNGKLSSLVEAYLMWAKNHYREPSQQSYNLQCALSPLIKFGQNIETSAFSPKTLKEYRDYVIENYNWSLSTINRRISTVIKMFKWAVSEEYIAPHIWQALLSVESLESRYCNPTIKISKKVKAVPIETVRATQEYLSPTLKDMVELQLLTGMRPGEMVKLRPKDLDKTGDIWLYTPSGTALNSNEHKTAHLGHSRIVCIGPQAQAILAKYLFRSDDHYCFSPKEVVAAHQKQRCIDRKTPISCGNKPGTNRKGSQKFSPHYTTSSYRKAIARACDLAFPAPTDLHGNDLQEWKKANRWTPHQLRHTTGTIIRSKFDPDTSRTVLGHQTLDATEIYAEQDLRKAMNAAREIG